MSANSAHAGPSQGVRPGGSDTSLRVLATPGFADYALVDSGNGRKLERFGRFTVDRPEPQAMWQPALEPGVWLRADAVFKERRRRGRRRRRALAQGLADAGDLAAARAGGDRAVPAHELPAPGGLSRAAAALAVDARLAAGRGRGEPRRVLNLFAYTGAASLIAARAGAEVTHVDASKRAIAWAKQNQAVSKLDEAPIRWILDDARKFVAREVRRGKTYHLILVDPPKFGRGPGGEVWDVFQHLAAAACATARRLLATPSALRWC